MTKQTLLRKLKKLHIIYTEKITLRSGKTSSFYCDIKKAYGYPDVLNSLADQIGTLLPKTITCVAASGYGGLPLASVVAARFNKKLALVRGAAKNHGKGGMIDGYIPTQKDRVAIIDDVLTSGSSTKETLSALNKIKAKTLLAVVAVNRGNPTLPIPYSSVFTIEEIVKK